MKEIRLILIDDNKLLRKGITDIIEQRPDFKILATFENCDNALTKVCKLKPDVLLLDLCLPDRSSLVFLKSLRKKCPEIKVVVKDIIPIQREIFDYVEAGISGFILKDAPLEDFLETIRSVAGGEKVLPEGMTKSLFSVIIDHATKKYSVSKLINTIRMTKQEREIVLFIADGLTNKEIGQKLHLSAFKVRGHVHNILEKMVLNTQIQFEIYASPDDNVTTTSGSIPSNDE